MLTITELSCVIAELFLIHMLLSGMFWRRNRPIWAFLGCYSLYGAIMAVVSLIPASSLVRTGVSVAGVFILALVLYESKLNTAAYATLVFNGLYVLTNGAMLVLLSLGHIRDDALLKFGNARMAYLITTHAVLLILVLLLLSVTKKRKTVTFGFLGLLVPGWVTSLVLGTMICKYAQESAKDLPAAFTIVAIGLLYMNLLIVFYSERLKASDLAQQEAALQKHHYAMQEKYYSQLHAEQEETRALRHDIGKYMLAMQALASENNFQKASEVLAQAQSALESCDNLVDVDNTVLSIILSEYLHTAKEAEINLKLDVQVPSTLFISAVDLYILIGNTLDNAIAACKEVPAEQRCIDLHLRLHNDVLFYQLKNPYREAYQMRKHEKGHGYGLNNVKQCLRKYYGDMEIEEENSCFSIRAHLNNA